MYSISIFEKAGMAPQANAVVFGIKAGLLSPPVVSDFEEYLIANCPNEGSFDLLIFEGSPEEALKVLADTGYEDDGRGKDVLRLAALKCLDSNGQDLLIEIEGVYADFGYPSDMEPFIYYMPSEEGDSSLEALIGRFRSFLATESERLGL